MFCWITLGPGNHVDQFDTPLWPEQVWCAANTLVPDTWDPPIGLVPLRIRAKSDPWCGLCGSDLFLHIPQLHCQIGICKSGD